MPSKARAQRLTSIPTTSMSRKTTAAPPPLRTSASKKRTSVREKVQKPTLTGETAGGSSWLKTCERIFGGGVAFEVAWEAWLADAPQFANTDWAIAAIGWIERIGAVAASNPECREKLAQLERIAQDAETVGLESAPLVHQLLRGELRLKLAIAKSDQALGVAALASLIDGLDCLLDREGSPHKNYLTDFPALAACWLRCFALAKRKNVAPSHLTEPRQEALAQCQWIPLRLAQLSRRDHSPIFSHGQESKIPAELIKEMLKLWGDKNVRRNAASLRSDIVTPTPKPAVEKIARAVCGDWTGVGIFRAEARPDASYLGVALNDNDFQLEIGASGIPLVCGSMNLSLTRDGHSLAPNGRWEEVCRHQEPEVEYWELERTHDRGVWIQRQVVLACNDRFAYISDNIVADGPGDLTYRLEVPLAADVGACPAPDTREITLQRGKLLAVVLPLAAEEWRATPSYFEFRHESGRLRFDGRTKQSRMSIPWVIDLRANRKIEEATWRQLRVAEDLQNLPRDIAVAFRWQIGVQQWMAYRSLAAPSNRTVLGQNLIGDFLLARVFADGKTKTIVEIE